MLLNHLVSFYSEIGLKTIVHAPLNIRRLLLLKTLRNFCYSGVTIILAIYLKLEGFSPDMIGVFIGMGFLGDLLKTFYLGLITDTVGRKKLMIWCYVVMFLTTMIFYLTNIKIIMWLNIVFGIMSTAGAEVSIFRPCEQAAISQLADFEQRSDYFTWYVFLGLLGMAAGSGVNGVMISYLQNTLKWEVADSYRFVFLSMSFLTLVLMFLCSRLDSEIEYTPVPIDETELTLLDEEEEQEEQDQTKDHTPPPAQSRESNAIDLLRSPNRLKITQIVLLYCVDVISKATIMDSWLSYYMVEQFKTEAKTVGTIFFLINSISAIMSLFGTVICKRYGPIYTMIYTHFPCSIFVFLIPFAPNMVVMLFLLVMRAIFKSMDVGSKTVFITSVVDDNERTAVLGLQNSFRILGQVFAPIITGMMANGNMQWVSFLFSATLRVCVYEVGIIVLFWKDRNTLGKRK
ncbi:hypothetical protein CANARDRAFT_202656 [[Candida] arabinofermentans NRRL YB-2248]|uniref:Major facilitator superfamily (MFS) profile domain-containing protein n=1 Tax=[Candida] arabinofermentans NRRL YB-2248 TaxID=983967 RepID=A0A1E4SW76_9ASCO|nr:hypothetical protein CANARDRAFT_202656 [[Candida] arabinofermentans NRRL YB-2248]